MKATRCRWTTPRAWLGLCQHHPSPFSVAYIETCTHTPQTVSARAPVAARGSAAAQLRWPSPCHTSLRRLATSHRAPWPCPLGWQCGPSIRSSVCQRQGSAQAWGVKPAATSESFISCAVVNSCAAQPTTCEMTAKWRADLCCTHGGSVQFEGAWRKGRAGHCSPELCYSKHADRRHWWPSHLCHTRQPWLMETAHVYCKQSDPEMHLSGEKT